jgi:hypothetical protein
VKSTSRFVAGTLVAASALALCGCPFEKTYLSFRPEYHTLIWPGEKLHDITDGGQEFGLEVAPGDNTQPEMGPMYIGGAMTLLTVDDDSQMFRGSIRARSSTLDRPSSTYPFAMVGFYFAHLELEDSWDRFGVGLEGGIGVRLGSKSVGLDLEMLFEYGYFTGGYTIMDTRLGGGLMFQF